MTKIIGGYLIFLVIAILAVHLITYFTLQVMKIEVDDDCYENMTKLFQMLYCLVLGIVFFLGLVLILKGA